MPKLSGIPATNPKESVPKLWSVGYFLSLQLAGNIARGRLEQSFKKESDVHLREAWILAACMELPCSQKQLGDVFAINTNVMVGLVDRLEKRRLIRRVRNSRNRREYLIELTPSGLKAIQKIMETEKSEQLASGAFSPLTFEELQTMKAFSDRIIDGYYKKKA